MKSCRPLASRMEVTATGPTTYRGQVKGRSRSGAGRASKRRAGRGRAEGCDGQAGMEEHQAGRSGGAVGRRAMWPLPPKALEHAYA